MSTQSGFDLTNALKAQDAEDEGRSFHVLHADGSPMYYDGDKPVTMTVAGTYSQRYRTADEKLANRRIQQRTNRSLSAAGLREAQIELAAACVVSWEGFFNGGEEMDCTTSNAVQVLTAAPWIREQVMEVMEDHAGFFDMSSAG